MDKEKIVVILLIVTIILSIGSILFTFSMSFDLPKIIQINQPESDNTGSVSFVVENPAGGLP